MASYTDLTADGACVVRESRGRTIYRRGQAVGYRGEVMYRPPVAGEWRLVCLPAGFGLGVWYPDGRELPDQDKYACLAQPDPHHGHPSSMWYPGAVSTIRRRGRDAEGRAVRAARAVLISQLQWLAQTGIDPVLWIEYEVSPPAELANMMPPEWHRARRAKNRGTRIASLLEQYPVPAEPTREMLAAAEELGRLLSVSQEM